MEVVIGVYMIEHTASGRRYVGKSVNVYRRLAAHLRSRPKERTFLSSAIEKHGRDAFSTTLLERCATEEEATAREQYWIRELGTRAPHGFNLTVGGDGVSGLVWSEESRERRAAAERGKKHTADTRAKMAASRRAFYATPEGVAVAAARGLRGAGRKHSAETRHKMRLAQLGRKMSAEAVEKNRQAKLNTSEETRAKLRAATLAMSEETRAKMRAAGLRRHAARRAAIAQASSGAANG